MTPEQQAVIDAAKAWTESNDADADGWAGPDRVLIDAVRALTPLAPPLPPEPEDLAAVRITYTHPDASPDVAQRINIMAEGDSRWFIAGSKGRAWSWAELHSDPGGVVSVELLLPASSVVDVALAREAAEALRVAGRRLESHADADHARLQHPGALGLCDGLVCSSDADALDAARTALARLDAATGGAR